MSRISGFYPIPQLSRRYRNRGKDASLFGNHRGLSLWILALNRDTVITARSYDRFGESMEVSEPFMDQVLQVIGALAILCAFVLSQFKRLSSDSKFYRVLNAAGSGLLAL